MTSLSQGVLEEVSRYTADVRDTTCPQARYLVPSQANAPSRSFKSLHRHLHLPTHAVAKSRVPVCRRPHAPGSRQVAVPCRLEPPRSSAMQLPGPTSSQWPHPCTIHTHPSGTRRSVRLSDRVWYRPTQCQRQLLARMPPKLNCPHGRRCTYGCCDTWPRRQLGPAHRVPTGRPGRCFVNASKMPVRLPAYPHHLVRQLERHASFLLPLSPAQATCRHWRSLWFVPRGARPLSTSVMATCGEDGGGHENAQSPVRLRTPSCPSPVLHRSCLPLVSPPAMVRVLSVDTALFSR